MPDKLSLLIVKKKSNWLESELSVFGERKSRVSLLKLGSIAEVFNLFVSFFAAVKLIMTESRENYSTVIFRGSSKSKDFIFTF